MDLTTTSRVSVLLLDGSRDSAGASFTRQNEDAIQQLIGSVSDAVVEYLDRDTERAQRTEYLDVEPLQTSFRLRSYPVSLVTGVWFDDLQAFGTSTALSAAEYRSPVLGGVSWLRLRYAPNIGDVTSYASLKVTYTGGMAANTGGFITEFPDIVGAVEQQVIYQYQRRFDLGTLSVANPTGTVSQGAVDWLPSVRSILDIHRRHHVN